MYVVYVCLMYVRFFCLRRKCMADAYHSWSQAKQTEPNKEQWRTEQCASSSTTVVYEESVKRTNANSIYILFLIYLLRLFSPTLVKLQISQRKPISYFCNSTLLAVPAGHRTIIDNHGLNKEGYC